MILVFYLFAGVLVWLSFRSFRGGIAYLEYFRSELAKPPSNYAPFVTVIAPCKGVDQGFEENLRALFEQDYPAYEIIFVVDSEMDAAVPVIKQILDSKPQKAETRPVGSAPCISSRLVIAPKATASAQKIENLREAVLHTAPESEAFAFVDSDARPSADWLRSLIAPLADENVGAATGYRWFISREPTFASELRSAWNASIASALGPNTGSNFTWGGSTAIRRETFDRIGMREKWTSTLADDFALTRALNAADLDIVFVPQALTASVENSTLSQMLEFTTRQMKITRVYATRLWVASFIGSALFNGVMIAA
ncbi:MAG: glycosyltransferase, partial [Pyrinomonadaceae bacterium]